MAKYGKDVFFSWDEDLDLEEILGEYTADEAENKNNSKVREANVYICPQCAKEYKSVSGFRGHVLKKHNKN